jgi:hypothetical protein
VQEGDKPHEAPDQLMKEAFGVLAELETLVSNVNKTNLATQLSDGRTLTQAIARRDTLAQEHALLFWSPRSAVGSANESHVRPAHRTPGHGTPHAASPHADEVPP